jgi:choline dehydrogenase-like flavoprotein
LRSGEPTERGRVLLLDAGPTDWNPFIRLPVGEALTVGGSVDWKFKTEAEPGFMGRSIDAARGKELGGSSAVNGMIYVRGHAGDFDDWAALGCEGWSYRDVLASFRRSESWNGAPSQERGSAGPLQTVFGRHRTPLYQAFLDAGQSLGFKVNPYSNRGDHEGLSWTQSTQTHKRARRCSSAHGHLGAAKGRKNTWGHMRPKSRGCVTSQSNNPLVQPRIQHNFLTDPHDIKVINRGFEPARKLNAQHSMDEYRGEEVDPGQAVQSEADITAYNRRVACSQYHPSGTCKMGIDDQAVVDPKLRVHGINGLRVADASIMPNVTSGNTNSPSIMIGERAAEIILTGA